jgi:hypothetical protein
MPVFILIGLAVGIMVGNSIPEKPPTAAEKALIAPPENVSGN